VCNRAAVIAWLFYAERYDEARPTAGATGASAAGVRAKVVASGDLLANLLHLLFLRSAANSDRKWGLVGVFQHLDCDIGTPASSIPTSKFFLRSVVVLVLLHLP